MQLKPHSRWFLWLGVAGSIASIVGLVFFFVTERKAEGTSNQNITNGVGANVGKVQGGNVDIQIRR